MRCPSCEAADPHCRVLRSEKTRTRHIYTCLSCGAGWSTVEMLQSDTVKVPTDWREAACRMRKAGMTFRAIGRSLGRPHQTIAYEVSRRARRGYLEAARRYEAEPGVRQARQIKQRIRREQQAEARA